jgi:hypothetical protein
MISKINVLIPGTAYTYSADGKFHVPKLENDGNNLIGVALTTSMTYLNIKW